MTKGTAARGSSPRPDGALDEGQARRVLVEQHGHLRALLGALDAAAVTVVRTCEPAPAMRGDLEKVGQALTSHMSDEERTIDGLLPRTKESDRARQLLREDHARQLEDLESVLRGAARSDDAISLALMVRAFVADVLLDMDLEDRRYLTNPA